MLVVHSLASWAAHITDAPNPTINSDSAERLPSPAPAPLQPLFAPEEPLVELDALSEVSDLTSLGDLSDSASDGEDEPELFGDWPSPSAVLDFASPGTQETTPGPGDDVDIKPGTAVQEDVEVGGGDAASPGDSRTGSAEVRRMIDLMNRQARR